MHPLPPAIALFVLTLCVGWIAGQAHGPIWFAIFALVGCLAGAFLLRYRAALGAVITAVTHIVEESQHPPGPDPLKLLTEHRAFLVRNRAQLDLCTPDTPDVHAIASVLSTLSAVADEGFRQAGIDGIAPIGLAGLSNDYDVVRAAVEARLATVDEALARLS